MRKKPERDLHQRRLEKMGQVFEGALAMGDALVAAQMLRLAAEEHIRVATEEHDKAALKSSRLILRLTKNIEQYWVSQEAMKKRRKDAKEA